MEGVATRGRGRPRRETPALTHDQVRTVALRLFRQHGFDGTSLRMIADALGVSPPALYYYFSSKQDLFYAGVEAGYTRTVEQADAVEGASAAERLRTLVTTEILNDLESLPDAGSRYSYNQLIRQLPERMQRQVSELERAHMASLRAVITDGIKAREFAKVNATAATFAIMAMIENLPLWYRREGELSPAEVAATLGDFAVKMVAHP